MTIIPYTPDHLAAINLQPEQVRDTFDESVPEKGDSWAMVIDGRSVAVGGLYPVLPNMAVAWAFIGADAGPHFVRMVRAMREKLDASSWPVVRAGALHGFAAAGRLLRMLGFQQVNAVTHYRARVYDVFEWSRHEH